MNHPSLNVDYPYLYNDPKERTAPKGKFPWVIYSAVAGTKYPEGLPPQHQKMRIRWEVTSLPPFWTQHPLAPFDPWAKEAASSLPKEQTSGLQKKENEIRALEGEIRTLTADNYISEKHRELSTKEMPAAERVQAIAMIEAERQAMPDIIRGINAQLHKQSVEFVPLATKIVEAMLKSISEAIQSRVDTAKADAKRFSDEEREDLEILSASPALCSLCRLGAQVEETLSRLEEPPDNGSAARDVLRAAGLIS
jgi:ATP/maltotriose-dependent transcriptional regulator MalT